jgi:hypothetical protein
MYSKQDVLSSSKKAAIINVHRIVVVSPLAIHAPVSHSKLKHIKTL